MEPIAIGVAWGAACTVGGVAIGHFIALHGRVPGEITEHKVEIAELGENDILVLTHEGVVSEQMTTRLKAQATESLDRQGRFAMVIGDGFKLAVIRRVGAPSTWSRASQVTPSHLPNYPIDGPLPVIPQPAPLEGNSTKPRKQARKS